MKLIITVLVVVMCCVLVKARSRKLVEAMDEINPGFRLLRDLVEQQGHKITSTTEDNGACPSDFYYIPTINRCYQAVNEALTWDAAGQRCRQINSKAHLVVIESELQWQTIVTVIQAAPVPAACIATVPGSRGSYWTSGQRINPALNTNFVWKPDQSPHIFKPLTYTKWAENQPDFDKGNENCLHLWGGSDWRWNDRPCAHAFCAICEIQV